MKKVIIILLAGVVIGSSCKTKTQKRLEHDKKVLEELIDYKIGMELKLDAKHNPRISVDSTYKRLEKDIVYVIYQNEYKIICDSLKLLEE